MNLQDIEKHLVLLDGAKKRKTTIKTLASKPANRVYVFDKQGILICNKSDKGLEPEATIDTSKFIEALSSQTISENIPLSSGILPPNLKYFEYVSRPNKNDPHNHIISIHEYPPCIYEAVFNTAASPRMKESYKISIPYIYFINYLSQNRQYNVTKQNATYVACNTHSMKSLQDKIYGIPFYNLYLGNICWNDVEISKHNKLPPLQYGQHICLSFLGSQFKTSTYPIFPPEIESYDKWEKESKKDPRFWQKVKWLPLAENLSKIEDVVLILRERIKNNGY